MLHIHYKYMYTYIKILKSKNIDQQLRPSVNIKAWIQYDHRSILAKVENRPLFVTPYPNQMCCIEYVN